jgi:hypothetical protein
MTQQKPPIYLQLFHGRDDPNEEMDDFGYDGPTIGPLEYLQLTYMCDIKFAMKPTVFNTFFPELADVKARTILNPTEGDIHHSLTIENDLILYDGKYYGDCSITTEQPAPKRIIATFVPQVWINGHAVTADPLGETRIDITEAVLAMTRDEALALRDDTDETDTFRQLPGAPDWIDQRSGPYYIAVEAAIAQYFDLIPNPEDEPDHVAHAY